MNSQIFNIKRFGLLLKTELLTGLKKNWISLLLICLIEVIVVLTIGTFFLILGQGWNCGGEVSRTIAAVIFLACLVMIVPAKLYGHVNNRESGPSYLMLPASRLEKYLSMILVSVIIIPAAATGIFAGIDALLRLIDPTAGGQILRIPDAAFLTGLSMDGATMNPALFIDDLIQSLLIFLFGTVFFRSAKVPKTVLCLVVIGQVVSFIALGGVAIMGFDTNPLDRPMIRFFVDHTALTDTISDTLTNIGLLVCIWFKLKTLKF